MGGRPNFFFSSAANKLKKLANSGWFVNGGTEAKKEELEDNSHRNGIVIDKSQYGGVVEKIKEDDFPIGAITMATLAKENVRETSQVQTEEPRKSSESGKSREIREAQNLRTKGVIFRNWNFTNNISGQVLIELIRNTDIFSEEEIRELVDKERLIIPAGRDADEGVRWQINERVISKQELKELLVQMNF